MKKLFLLIIVLIIWGVFVLGAQGLITSVDFNVDSIKGFKLGDGDGISFMFKDKEYVISVDQIGKTTGVRLKSFIYTEDGEKETYYIPLTSQFSYKLDFDKNDVYDLHISLAEVNQDDGRATIIFKAIQEDKNGNEVTSEASKDSFKIDSKGIIIAILIVIAGLVAYFTFRKR